MTRWNKKKWKAQTPHSLTVSNPSPTSPPPIELLPLSLSRSPFRNLQLPLTTSPSPSSLPLARGLTRPALPRPFQPNPVAEVHEEALELVVLAGEPALGDDRRRMRRRGTHRRRRPALPGLTRGETRRPASPAPSSSTKAWSKMAGPPWPWRRVVVVDLGEAATTAAPWRARVGSGGGWCATEEVEERGREGLAILAKPVERGLRSCLMQLFLGFLYKRYIYDPCRP
ncbi:hypothetical protein VPH35_113653 [Triticum aestivum]